MYRFKQEMMVSYVLKKIRATFLDYDGMRVSWYVTVSNVQVKYLKKKKNLKYMVF